MSEKKEPTTFKPTEKALLEADFTYGGNMNFLDKASMPLNENELAKIKFEFAKIMKEHKIVGINLNLQRKW